MKAKLIVLLIVLSSGIWMSCNTKISPKEFKSEKESVTVQEASNLLGEGALLIDVREVEELAEQSYDVPSVKNIPLGEIDQRLQEIPRDIQLILACRSGKRSGKAFLILKEKGFINMANMEGGMNAWSAAGLPTKAGTDSSNVNRTDTLSNSEEKDLEVVSATALGTPPLRVNKNKKASLNLTRLEVYCFHGTRQCETCINMKANTKSTLDKYFADQLKSGRIVFAIIDVDDSKNAILAERFQATGTALMINNVKAGKDNISDWSNFAFDYANDAEKFIPGLKDMVTAELNK